MKKTALLLTALMLMTFLAGCGSIFSTGNSKAEDNKGKDIKITDTYIHKDPEGLDYAVRYAYCSALNDPELIDGYKENYGLDFVQEFMIIYADKDDKPLMQYDYYVLADEENAKKCAEELDPNSFKAEGVICLSISDAETTQLYIDMNIQYASLDKNCASAYAEFMKEGMMFLDVQQ